MKLKTLKDFKNSLTYSINVVSIIALRREAIKYIKELQSDYTTIGNGKSETEEGFEEYGTQKINQSSIILWIKYFFNITEEDL